MDEKNKEYCVGPICYHCGGLHGGKHVLLRWAIGLAILALTFWMGVKVGELKSLLGNYGYGYGMHSGYFRSVTPMMNSTTNDGQAGDRFWMMQ